MQAAPHYDNICRTCHGINVVSGGMIPDLRLERAETHRAFHDIVLGGSRAEPGMASLADVLTLGQADAVHACIGSEAAKMRRNALDSR